jgi:hypothetical protein
LRGGGYYKRKDKGKASSKGKQDRRQCKGIRIKPKQAKRRKSHQGKGRLTSQGLWGGLQGTPRHPRVVVIVPGSLVYVSCVVLFSLRPSIYIYSKLVFPMGGFFQCHVDQKHVSFSCMLRSVDQHFKVKRSRGSVMCFDVYCMC